MVRVHRRDRTARLDENVKQHVQAVRRAILAGGHDAVQRETLIRPLAADEHAAPVAADRAVVVVPAWDAVPDLLLHAPALLALLPPFHQPPPASFARPRRPPPP